MIRTVSQVFLATALTVPITRAAQCVDCLTADICVPAGANGYVRCRNVGGFCVGSGLCSARRTGTTDELSCEPNVQQLGFGNRMPPNELSTHHFEANPALLFMLAERSAAIALAAKIITRASWSDEDVAYAKVVVPAYDRYLTMQYLSSGVASSVKPENDSQAVRVLGKQISPQLFELSMTSSTGDSLILSFLTKGSTHSLTGWR